MKAKKAILSLSCLMITAGCSTATVSSTRTAAVPVRYSAYLGKTLPLFILDNGSPYSQKKLANGNRLYAWNSGQHRVYRYSPLRKEFGDDFMRSACEIRLQTSPKGRILAITALNNDRKNWDADSCRDYLK